MKILKRFTTFISLVALAVGMTIPANAGVSVSIGGSTDWQVKAVSSTQGNSFKVGQKVRGSSQIIYTARILGIPMPVTGYYSHSYPTNVSKPVLISKSGTDSFNSNFKITRNSYLNSSQWEVRGYTKFWGNKEVKISSSATASSRKSGYFYSGTYNCGNDCTNAHAVQLVSVTR